VACTYTSPTDWELGRRTYLTNGEWKASGTSERRPQEQRGSPPFSLFLNLTLSHCRQKRRSLATFSNQPASALLPFTLLSQHFVLLQPSLPSLVSLPSFRHHNHSDNDCDVNCQVVVQRGARPSRAHNYSVLFPLLHESCATQRRPAQSSRVHVAKQAANAIVLHCTCPITINNVSPRSHMQVHCRMT
jgi:hypothetical protein